MAHTQLDRNRNSPDQMVNSEVYARGPSSARDSDAPAPGYSNRHQVRGCAAFICTSLLLGGAGTNYPILAAIVQMAAIALFYLTAWRSGIADIASPSRAANWLLAGILLLPLLQLVPLPYSFWAGLPGRQLASEILTKAGVAGEARPLTLNPYATLGCLLELLPAAVCFLTASRLSRPDQLVLIRTVVGVAVFSACLGALQKVTGGTLAFETAHGPDGPGVFVNRNHQATLLLASIPLAAVLARSDALRGQRFAYLLYVAVMFLLGAGAIATTSRMGLVLLPLAIAAAALISAPSRLSARWAIACALAGAVLSLLILQSSAVRASLLRFTGGDIRTEYWADTIVALGQCWPWGSGFGTFSDIYPTVENMNYLSPLRVENAHNDYLEVLLEGGVAAAGLILLVLVLFAKKTYDTVRADRDELNRPINVAAIFGILSFLLHSSVDYPLRMMSLSVLYALFWAVLVSRPSSMRLRRGDG